MKKQTQKAQNIKVIKDEEKPETPEIIAQALITISKGFEEFLNSSLSRRALITLLLLKKCSIQKLRVMLWLILISGMHKMEYGNLIQILMSP